MYRPSRWHDEPICELPHWRSAVLHHLWIKWVRGNYLYKKIINTKQDSFSIFLPSPTWPTIVDFKPAFARSSLVSYTSCGSRETGTLYVSSRHTCHRNSRGEDQPYIGRPALCTRVRQYRRKESLPFNHWRFITPQKPPLTYIFAILPHFIRCFLCRREFKFSAPMVLHNLLYGVRGLSNGFRGSLELEEECILHRVRSIDHSSRVDGRHHFACSKITPETSIMHTHCDRLAALCILEWKGRLQRMKGIKPCHWRMCGPYGVLSICWTALTAFSTLGNCAMATLVGTRGANRNVASVHRC